jgi:hypothetical protein
MDTINHDAQATVNREEFLRLIQEHCQGRAGIDKLLDYLTNNSDFFTAPASTRFHGSYVGGLCEHSLNVYHALKRNYISLCDTYDLQYSEETLVLVSLLHDVCKIGCYHQGTRNVKDENGVWQKVPVFTYDDPLPYGHGEKSVYVISGFIRLSREEAFAIRYHMGFSDTENKTNVGKTFEQYPLAFLLSVADMEATYLIEGKHSQ